MKIAGLGINRFVILFVLITGVIAGVFGGIFFALFNDLPQIRSLESFRPSIITRVYSADKVLIAELFIEKRDLLPINEIPLYIKKALVSTEDRNFYKHSGIDLKGILRAIIKDVRALKFVEGASTITQQLAKTLFLTPKKSLIRKLKEALLAFQLERRYTKDEILGLYLNQVYFGSGAYGIVSAARIFFGKSVKDLTLAECALVAGMPKSPSRYSPLVNKELAIKRRNIVLKQMLITKIITAPEYKKALNEPLTLADKNKTSVKAPYFVEYVKKSLEKIIGSTILYKGGLTIHTTLSFEMQKSAELAVSNRLSELETRMKRNNIKTPDPQCALVSIDVMSGGILAMIGGKNYYDSQYNRAVSALRQPGSAFKPIVYAHAIERDFPQNMMILDAPIAFKSAGDSGYWHPENFSKTFKGEMTLRKALALSKNIPAVRLIEILGPSSVVQFAHKLGIESHLFPYFSLSLGSSEVTLLELTSAYCVFPNMGKHIKPFGVTEIHDHKGKIIWRAKPQKTIAMSRAGAAIITNMLEGVVKEGTGKKALTIRRPIAGKTGTTNDFKDALFLGFSPAIATGVWVGLDDHHTLGKGETGARAALPIWIDFMKQALATRPFQYFDLPDGVTRIYIDSSTGLQVQQNSPQAVDALFKKGTGPKKDQ
jgi:penicillin-binding protein 1A